jgi:type IV secretory pathway VirB10-like protein
MNNLTMMRTLQLAVGGALLMCASLSHAQFSWIDAKGVKQFSDRPPPPGTPQNKILKARNMPVATEEAAAPAPATAEAKPKAVPATLADREAEYRKRKTEQVEMEKKASAEADDAKRKATACNAARQSRTAIDTGAPMRESNAERSFLSDQQRAERRNEAEKTIAEHCG